MATGGVARSPVLPMPIAGICTLPQTMSPDPTILRETYTPYVASRTRTNP